jgi:enoyl-CoA hydratase
MTFSRRANGVLLITLDRPEKYNAADEVMHAELARVWIDVAADAETRVAVITGAGKAFSAGGDLAMVERMAGDYDRVSHMLKEMSDLVYNIINCDKPMCRPSTASRSAPAPSPRCWPTSPSPPRTRGSATGT